jgi:hypothetical protein
MSTERQSYCPRQGATKMRALFFWMGIVLCEAQGGTWKIGTLVGDGKSGSRDGTSSEAQFKSPSDVAIRMDPTIMYIADTGNGMIRKYDSASGQVESLSVILPGKCPTSIALAITSTTNHLVVANACNHSVCTIDLDTEAIDLMVGGLAAGYQEGPKPMSMFASPR